MAPSGDKYLLTLEKGFDCRWRELIWCLAYLDLVEINPIWVGIGLWDSQVAIIQSARLKMLLNRKLRTILICLVWFPLFCWIPPFFVCFPLFCWIFPFLLDFLCCWIPPFSNTPSPSVSQFPNPNLSTDHPWHSRFHQNIFRNVCNFYKFLTNFWFEW